MSCLSIDDNYGNQIAATLKRLEINAYNRQCKLVKACTTQTDENNNNKIQTNPLITNCNLQIVVAKPTTKNNKMACVPAANQNMRSVYVQVMPIGSYGYVTDNLYSVLLVS